MRVETAFAILFLLAWAPSQAGEGRASSFDAACRAVMPPYYAALLASARGNGEATLRQVVILESRWQTLLRLSASDVPAWLHDTVHGQQVAAYIAAKIESARGRLPRDVSAAHMELEGVRAVLRDARTRHGARTLDDAITDYHEAMERLFSHAGLENEITLTSGDFTIIRDDVRAARSAWTRATASNGLPAAPGSTSVTAITTLLTRIGRAADADDAAVLQRTTRELKEAYFDLLAALARQR
jgi:hypothetical protein